MINEDGGLGNRVVIVGFCRELMSVPGTWVSLMGRMTAVLKQS